MDDSSDTEVENMSDTEAAVIEMAANSSTYNYENIEANLIEAAANNKMIPVAEMKPFDEKVFEHLITRVDKINQFTNNETKELNIENRLIFYNYCETCQIPMASSDDNYYECTSCGLVKSLVGNTTDCNQDSASTLRAGISTTFGNRRQMYSVFHDNAKTQRRLVLEQLLTNNSEYVGNKISLDILQKTATVYNDLQKMEISQEETVTKRSLSKKFIKRAAPKDELLGALLYNICRNQGVYVRKKMIAEFMKLNNLGLSGGENQLRTLLLDHKELDVKIADEDQVEIQADRYLEALALEKVENYKNFIIDLVNKCNEKRVGISSLTSTKVAGAIWILITKLKLNITYTQVENSVDKIRKNTFVKFANAVEKNILKVAEPFIKHNIPTGIHFGKLVKITK